MFPLQVSIKEDVPLENCVSNGEQNCQTTESVDELGLRLLEALLSMNSESLEVTENSEDQQRTHETNAAEDSQQAEFIEPESTKKITSSSCVIDNSGDFSNVEKANRDISGSVKEANETLHAVGESIIRNSEDNSSVPVVNKSETNHGLKETKQRKGSNGEASPISFSLDNQETDSRNDGKLSELEYSQSLNDNCVSDELNCLVSLCPSDKINAGNSECNENSRHEGANSEHMGGLESGGVPSKEETISLENCGENPSAMEVSGSRKKSLSLPELSNESRERNSTDYVAQEIINKVNLSNSVGSQYSQDQNSQLLGSNVSELEIFVSIKEEVDNDDQVERSMGEMNSGETFAVASNESEHELDLGSANKIALELSELLRTLREEASHQNIEAPEDRISQSYQNEVDDRINTSIRSSVNQPAEHIEENLGDSSIEDYVSRK